MLQNFQVSYACNVYVVCKNNVGIITLHASYISQFIFSNKEHTLTLPPGSLSWKDEFRRLYYTTPWNGIQNSAEDTFLNDDSQQNKYASPEMLKSDHYGKV